MPKANNSVSRPYEYKMAVVAGAGRSGIAAARLLRKQLANVRLIDKNSAAISESEKIALTEEGIEVVLGNQDAAHFADADLVVASPGIPLRTLEEFFVSLPESAKPEIISETEYAYRCLGGEPILAVTGTSGKTTTASLAAAMLESQGYKVFLGGNIGTPLSEYVLAGKKADVLVLEVSSFQLQGCTTFKPHVAVLLNITPNHLDYHKDMQEYVAAKLRIFLNQDTNDFAVVGIGAKKYLDGRQIKGRISWIEENQDSFPSHLFGKHNQINIESAWKACSHFGVERSNAARAVDNFKPLEHRLEKVGEIDGTIFVNDSKCTTVSSLEVALASFDRPIRLLCGGKYKGGDLASLGKLIKQHVCEICLFGANRDKFEAAWQGLAPMQWQPTLEEAMKKLNSTKKPGDVILLSPATSSFDQYDNYEKRGEDFKRVFALLKQGA